MFVASLIACLVCVNVDCGIGHQGLETYLKVRNETVTEGYCTGQQEDQFITALKPYKDKIASVLEIGFNAGHSSELILSTCPNARMTSFDINHHSYTKVALEYIQKTYPDRLTFVAGNSVVAIPEFAQAHPTAKFDLIYVDGDHSYEGCLTDITNCKTLATPDTLLWIDDYNCPTVAKAIDECVRKGVIKIVGRHTSYDPRHFVRDWVEARYVIN